jgi:hypothetical protein
MGYGCSDLTEENLLACSTKASNEAAGELKLEVSWFSSARLELPGSSPPEGYAEDCDEPRMKLGKRGVLARRGWAGEKVRVFSILLAREDPFKVIPKRKDHDAH